MNQLEKPKTKHTLAIHWVFFAINVLLRLGLPTNIYIATGFTVATTVILSINLCWRKGIPDNYPYKSFKIALLFNICYIVFIVATSLLNKYLTEAESSSQEGSAPVIEFYVSIVQLIVSIPVSLAELAYCIQLQHRLQYDPLVCALVSRI